jgi:biotin operon repressor
MLYRQSLEIEQRLDAALRLIRTGRFSTPQLAKKLHVSIPTVSRCVLALRHRGHDIQAKREGDTWRYILARSARRSASPARGPFVESSAERRKFRAS